MRGAWLTTAIQVASRVLVLMVAVYPHVEVKDFDRKSVGGLIFLAGSRKHVLFDNGALLVCDRGRSLRLLRSERI